MELIYLWVEDYKNIHKQGFNFSPRFHCEYDNDKNELTIEENEDCIPDFFGENINITAIVGKNGSGKSSILEILEDIRDGFFAQGYLLCFKQGTEKYILSYLYSDSKIKCNRDDFLEIEGTLFSFLSYSAEMPYPYFEEKIQKFKNKLRMSFEQINIFDILAKYLGEDIKLTSFMFIPELIELKQNDKLLEKYIDDIRPDAVVRSNNPENGIPYEDCHNEREEYSTDNVLEAFFFLNIIKNDLSSYLCDNGFYNSKDLVYDTRILEEFYNSDEYELNDKGYSLDEYNTILKTKYYDVENLTEESIQLLRKYSRFLIFDFEDTKNRKYNDLSHGEKSIFGQFLHIYDRLANNNETCLCVLLDEPDISLHPNWQKQYLSELEKSFFNVNKSLHFVIMTHSPFLLSDIPKQNIIFLDKDENGNCKVVDGLKEKKQTFGANIHTLLSDSFFMEDGLMGEFAKGKINDIIDFHKLVKKNRHTNCLTKIYLHSKQKKFWQTQKIIGEEYLKQVIKNHLVEIEKKLLGKDGAKQEEIKRVEAYLESLKK